MKYCNNYFSNINWLKTKGYVHLDLPIVSGKMKKNVYFYITNPDNIKKHAFLPLIRRVVKSYPYREKIVEGEKKKAIKKKVRNISFSSHLDSAIYSYYAYGLYNKYEQFLKSNFIEEEVVAYRKIENNNRKGNKCNIDIAYDVFEKIKYLVTNNRSDLGVITFDIKGFFDNLDHGMIKESWKRIMGYKNMPEDVYHVYKSIVHYSYIYETEIFNKFKDRLLTKRGLKKVKRIEYMRDKNVIAFCPQEGISEIRRLHLIKQRKKTETYGIPQGLPISAIIANVYMANFDVEVKKYIQQIGGVYRRYSDDIIVLCPSENIEKCKDFVINEIKKYKLEIEQRKTNTFLFTLLENEKIICQHEEKGINKKLEYLGFSFDGERILIKDASLCKFYRKMHRYINRSSYYAVHINNKTVGKLFISRLITRFTFAGSRTHPLRIRDKNNHSKFIKIKNKVTYGNFLTYVNKSAIIMNEPAIKHQLKRVSKKLNRYILLAKEDVSKRMTYIIRKQIEKYGRVYI